MVQERFTLVDVAKLPTCIWSPVQKPFDRTSKGTMAKTCGLNETKCSPANEILRVLTQPPAKQSSPIELDSLGRERELQLRF